MRHLVPDDRVLVRMPSWLGDFVACEPLARALVDFFGRADGAGSLSFVGPQPFLDLLGPALGDARRIRSDAPWRAWRGHDVALLLDGSARSALRALAAGIPTRVGLGRGGRTALLSVALRPALERGRTPLGLGRRGRWPRALPRPFSGTAFELGSWLGLVISEPRPRLAVAESEQGHVAERRRKLAGFEPGAFLVVNVGARPASAKGYPAASWALVIDGLARRTERTVFVVAGPGEESALDATLSLVREPAVHAVSEPLASLPELAAWCDAAELVVTVDGGVRHVAAAVGARQVVLFGPTDPRHTAAFVERQSLLAERVECGPCHRESCPLTDTKRHQCMRLLLPERVVDEVCFALRASAAPRLFERRAQPLAAGSRYDPPPPNPE